MKPRHAAALALVGWYLMVPPPSRGWQHAKRPVDLLRLDARFRNGASRVSLDSAKECENTKDEDYGESTKALDRLQFPRNDNPNDFYAER
jgi:hypothetical protein